MAEGGTIDVDEFEALGREIGAKRLAELCDVGALIDGGAVELALHDLLHVLGQALEGALVAEDPVAIQTCPVRLHVLCTS